MREFIPVTVGMMGLGAGLGALTAAVFDLSMWSSIFVGAGIPALIMLGFYICFMLIVIGFKELFLGGR